MKLHECKLEANEINWRLCVSRTAGVLRGKLGRMSVAEREIDIVDETPFPRNRFFVGRENELAEIEMGYFINHSAGRTTLRPEGLADEEMEEVGGKNGKFINLEVGNCKEQNLETWVEPVIGRNSLKRTKLKKTKGFGSSIVCINGGPDILKDTNGIMVGWEARYFRQNIINLSINLGLDVSADEEKERGRIRSFDEQETEAFKRVKQELFRDTRQS
ncbi:hypothetical protein Hdeb2414_s0012g00393001 [Helianthus debilis subsp. tardiflorus]